MKTFKVLLNKSFSIFSGSPVLYPAISNDYYAYLLSNGGGMVNNFNVRSFLSDTRNADLTKDFISFLTGNTTSPQALNILDSDAKLADVFNDYYQKVVLLSTTNNLTQQSTNSQNNSNGSEENLLTLDNGNGNSNNFGTLTQEQIAVLLNSTTGNTNSINNSRGINISQLQLQEIQKNLSAGSLTNSYFYHSPWAIVNSESEFINNEDNNTLGLTQVSTSSGGSLKSSSSTSPAINNLNSSPIENPGAVQQNNNSSAGTGPSNSNLPAVPGLISQNQYIWQDTTSEESYYVSIFMSENFLPTASQRFEPAVESIDKQLLQFYPQFSGITSVTPSTSNGTRVRTLLNSFIDLNLELNEATFYQNTAIPMVVEIDTSPHNVGGA